MMHEIFKPKEAEELLQEFFCRIKPSNFYRLLIEFGNNNVIVKIDDERNLLIFRIKAELSKREGIEIDEVVKTIRGAWGKHQLAFSAYKGHRRIDFMMTDDLGKRVIARVVPHKKMKKIPKYKSHYDIIDMKTFDQFMIYLNK